MAVEDTTNPEEVVTATTEETSTEEETQDTEDVSLEEMDESFDDADDDETEESEDDEEEEDSASSDTEESTEESKEDDVEETDSESTDTETEETSAAERKRLNDEAAKARIEAKNAKAEAEAVRRETEEANIERYLQEAGDDEAEKKAREADVRSWRLTQKEIALNESTLQTTLQQAVASIDLFTTGTPAVKERLLRAIDQFEANNIVTDKKGRPVEIKGNLMQHLQQEADSIRELLGDGARAQDKAKTNQKSRTMTPPAKPPKKAKVDPDLEAFDSVANG